MSDAPYPSDPAKRHSAALTDGPDRAGARAMLKAIGFTDEDLAKPIVGVGDDLDRDDALQPQPAPPGRARQGRHPGRRRDADGVQHDRDQRRRDDGHRGDEDLARQPRGRRRLDRARHPRPADRRRRVHRGLRQDRARRPRWRSAGSTCPGIDPLRRDDQPGRLQGRAQRHRRERLRGDRRLPGGQDHARRADRDRERGLPRPGRLRRPVHGQHDEHGHGVHRALAGGAERHPGRGARPRTRPPTAPASWSWTSSGATSGPSTS